MKIVGCDLHTRCRQIPMLDTETSELTERRPEHESGEARTFYASLLGPVRVGIEATGRACSSRVQPIEEFQRRRRLKPKKQ